MGNTLHYSYFHKYKPLDSSHLHEEWWLILYCCFRIRTYNFCCNFKKFSEIRSLKNGPWNLNPIFQVILKNTMFKTSCKFWKESKYLEVFHPTKIFGSFSSHTIYCNITLSFPFQNRISPLAIHTILALGRFPQENCAVSEKEEGSWVGVTIFNDKEIGITTVLGGGVLEKLPSVGEVWRFSETAQFI